MSKMYYKQSISIRSNSTCGNCLKKARSRPAVGGEVWSKGEELDCFREAACIVLSAWLIVLLLPGIVPYHPQPEKTMLLVVEGYGGADICLERRKTLCRPCVDQLQGGVQGNADGKLEAERTVGLYNRENSFEFLFDPKTHLVPMSAP